MGGGGDEEHRPGGRAGLHLKTAGDPELRRRLVELGGGHGVALNVLAPGDARRRRAVQGVTQHRQLELAAWAQHQAMGIEGDRTREAVGRLVVDGEAQGPRIG